MGSGNENQAAQSQNRHQGWHWSGALMEGRQNAEAMVNVKAFCKVHAVHLRKNIELYVLNLREEMGKIETQLEPDHSDPCRPSRGVQILFPGVTTRNYTTRWTF